MIPRRIAIGVSIVLMIAGFIAWQAISRDNIVGPGEVVPGEIPEIVTGLEEVPVADQMMAYVPAVRAAEHDLAHLPPPEVGLLAVVGNRGEFFFTRQLDARGEVWLMRAAGAEMLWSTETEQLLELVSVHGSELFLKFIDVPYKGPRDAWEPGGFYGLDMFAPGVGVHPAHIEDETVAMVRRYIR